ncbi:MULTISPECIES: GDSL family lipase [unclassified Wolbachia]|nr:MULTISPECIES: GDSL family lipase [unclassified Wolbachia]
MHLVLNEYGVKHVIVENVTEVVLILALIKTKSKRAGWQSLHRVSIQN